MRVSPDKHVHPLGTLPVRVRVEVMIANSICVRVRVRVWTRVGTRVMVSIRPEGTLRRDTSNA